MRSYLSNVSAATASAHNLSQTQERQTRTRKGALFHMISIPGQRINDCDLLHREVRNDFDFVLLYDEHFLDTDAVAEALAVLGLKRKRHPFLDLHRMIERPDARDDRRIVLRQTETMTP